MAVRLQNSWVASCHFARLSMLIALLYKTTCAKTHTHTNRVLI